MAMKLLPKSDILAAKASEQRQRIDEGARIARKVDAVRETLLTEERKLEEFRRKKVAEVDAQLSKLRGQRDALAGEVANLARQRKEMLKPLDREWAEVTRAKEKAKHDTENAQAALGEARREAKEAKDAIREAGDALSRALLKEEKWREKLESACVADDAAQERLRSATEVHEDAEELRRNMEIELAHRDADSAARERGITMREDNLAAAEKELENGWRLLRDREATFERRITRAKSQ